MTNFTAAHDNSPASAVPPHNPPPDPVFGIIEHQSEHGVDAGNSHGTQWSLAAAVEQREAARDLLDTNLDGRVSILEHARAALGSLDDRLEDRADDDEAASVIASVVHRVVDRFDSDLFAGRSAQSEHHEDTADRSDGELGNPVSDQDVSA